MKKEELLKIAKEFDIEGNPKDVKLIESGHINKTYLVEYDTAKDYILQYVNTNVFPNIKELMSNIVQVTEYIKKKGKSTTATFIKTKGEEPSYIFKDNWRMQEFIENTKTYISTESMEILKEAGKAVGDFQKQLDGFNAETLYEIIPKFHYTPNRVRQMYDAINSKENNEKRKERFEKAKPYIEFLTEKKRLDRSNAITSKLEDGTIPLRVTHNDTKLSNILFDKDTDKYIALIDLDTIMPGSIVYDYGEGIRTGITTAPEDEQDLSKIFVDLRRFEAFTEGFLSEMKGTITNEELELLPIGAWMMTYENTTRFLADYLNGDTYFNVNPEIQDHNLIRVKAQTEIIKQLEQNENKMKGLIEKYGL